MDLKREINFKNYLSNIVIRLFFILEDNAMGNKEAKYKAIFEGIDTSGNKKVDEFELLNFLNPHQNPKVKEVFTELSNVEIEEFWKVAKQMEKHDLDGDRNYTFEEFYQAMEENEDVNKLILKIAEIKEED